MHGTLQPRTFTGGHGTVKSCLAFWCHENNPTLSISIAPGLPAATTRTDSSTIALPSNTSPADPTNATSTSDTTTTATPTPDPTIESSSNSSSQSQYIFSTDLTQSSSSSSVPTNVNHTTSSPTSPLLSSEHLSQPSLSSGSSMTGLGILPQNSSTTRTLAFSTPSPGLVPQEAPLQPTPKQALSLGHSSRAGPIAGGVISGLLIVAALLLLWCYRRKILNRWSGRHRVAPSSEFLNAGIRALTPRDGMLGAERQQRVMSMHEGSCTVLTGPDGATQHIRRSSSAPPSNPLPSPPGLFADRLGNSQWLNDASRRREELYQATTSSGSTDSQQDLVASAYPRSPPPLMVHYTPPAAYPSSPRDVSSHARQESVTTAQTSHEGSGRRNSDPFQDQSDSEEDMQTTSLMLSPSKVTRVDAQADAATGTNVTLAEGIGWAV
ncbi:hypothetical protein BC629DRAFT_1436922 [Irpex lacteus]|nr:hypothetical protein BC629DRAFT_1436922 [Irpex lacteus]